MLSNEATGTAHTHSPQSQAGKRNTINGYEDDTDGGCPLFPVPRVVAPIFFLLIFSCPVPLFSPFIACRLFTLLFTSLAPSSFVDTLTHCCCDKVVECRLLFAVCCIRL